MRRSDRGEMREMGREWGGGQERKRKDLVKRAHPHFCILCWPLGTGCRTVEFPV